jgi:hypothetical protein
VLLNADFERAGDDAAWVGERHFGSGWHSDRALCIESKIERPKAKAASGRRLCVLLVVARRWALFSFGGIAIERPKAKAASGRRLCVLLVVARRWALFSFGAIEIKRPKAKAASGRRTPKSLPE